MAAQLVANDDAWGYANLAIRGKKLQQVLDEQLDAALALEPTLVTLYAGGNDILRPTVNLDGLMERYRSAVGKLSGTGARVVLFTGFDSAKAPLFRSTRGRTAIYNEHVRKISEDFGTDLVDFWHMKHFQDWRYWDVDRMHLASPATPRWPRRSWPCWVRRMRSLSRRWTSPRWSPCRRRWPPTPPGPRTTCTRG